MFTALPVGRRAGRQIAASSSTVLQMKTRSFTGRLATGYRKPKKLRQRVAGMRIKKGDPGHTSAEASFDVSGVATTQQRTSYCNGGT